VLVVGLGCEGVSSERIAQGVAAAGRPVELVSLQEVGGWSRALAAGEALGAKLAAHLGTQAREACGWELQVASALRRFDRPTADELALVRLFDPRRYFLAE
jgi:altronate dehydratase